MASSRKRTGKKQVEDSAEKQYLQLLGSKIKARRKELRLSQRKLEELSGVSNGHISNVERGERKIGTEYMRALADALSLPYNYLLDDDIAVGDIDGTRSGKSHEPSKGYEARGRVPLLLEPFLESAALPIEEMMHGEIDLQEALVADPKRTVVVRVTGETMQGAGIRMGDLVVVETDREPSNGEIVAARYNGILVVRRFVRLKETTLLVSHDGAHIPFVVGPSDSFDLVGVVRYAIHAPMPLRSDE
jgi:DNA polymerase V